MHHIVEVAWQTTSTLLRSQRRNAMRMGCWGRRVGSDVSICTIVVGLHDRRCRHCCGAKDAMPWEWVAEADVLARMCLYAPFWKYELLRNRLAMCELLSYERILDLCYEHYWSWKSLLKLYYEFWWVCELYRDCGMYWDCGKCWDCKMNWEYELCWDYDCSENSWLTVIALPY